MMSGISLEKILADARRLSGRMKEHEASADSLIRQANNLQKQVESVRMYQENLADLQKLVAEQQTQAAGDNPTAAAEPQANSANPAAASLYSGPGLILENREIKQLMEENEELRQLLDDHQLTLELIMRKYRHSVSSLVSHIQNKQSAAIALQQIKNGIYTNGSDHTNRICDMAQVMKRVISLDDEEESWTNEVIAQLRLENKAMKELLVISESYGSMTRRDTCTQTDIDTHMEGRVGDRRSGVVSGTENKTVNSKNNNNINNSNSVVIESGCDTSFSSISSDASDTTVSSIGSVKSLINILPESKELVCKDNKVVKSNVDNKSTTPVLDNKPTTPATENKDINTAKENKEINTAVENKEIVKNKNSTKDGGMSYSTTTIRRNKGKNMKALLGVGDEPSLGSSATGSISQHTDIMSNGIDTKPDDLKDEKQNKSNAARLNESNVKIIPTDHKGDSVIESKSNDVGSSELNVTESKSSSTTDLNISDVERSLGNDDSIVSDCNVTVISSADNTLMFADSEINESKDVETEKRSETVIKNIPSDSISLKTEEKSSGTSRSPSATDEVKISDINSSVVTATERSADTENLTTSSKNVATENVEKVQEDIQDGAENTLTSEDTNTDGSTVISEAELDMSEVVEDLSETTLNEATLNDTKSCEGRSEDGDCSDDVSDISEESLVSSEDVTDMSEGMEVEVKSVPVRNVRSATSLQTSKSLPVAHNTGRLGSKSATSVRPSASTGSVTTNSVKSPAAKTVTKPGNTAKVASNVKASTPPRSGVVAKKNATVGNEAGKPVAGISASPKAPSVKTTGSEASKTTATAVGSKAAAAVKTATSSSEAGKASTTPAKSIAAAAGSDVNKTASSAAKPPSAASPVTNKAAATATPAAKTTAAAASKGKTSTTTATTKPPTAANSTSAKPAPKT